MDYAPPKSIPPQEYEYTRPPEKKPRGCFFYGCLISSILTLLAIIAIVAIFFVVINKINTFLKENTDTKPEQIPASAMPLADRDALKKRVDAYFEDLKAGKAKDTLILTADDINALIEENATFKDTVHVDIDGEKVKGKISYPISNLPWPFKDLNGRYANGSATLRINLVDGFLVVRAEDIVIKGQPLPADVAQQLKEQNLAKDLKDPKAVEFFSHIQTIEVKDGKIIITPKVESGAKPDTDPAKDVAPKEDMPKDEKPKDDMPKDEKPKEEPPKEEKPKDAPPAETPPKEMR